MTPSDQMSVRASTCFDACICSGDMYAGDPTSAFARVVLTSRLAPGALRRDLRDPEVEHLDGEAIVCAPDAEEICGLQVPVNDAQRVRLGDGLAGLENELNGLFGRHHTALLEPGREVAALQVLHDHVRSTVLKVPNVDHTRDVLALDLDRGPGFPRETRHGFGVPEGLGQEELQRDFLVEMDVMSGDDHAHAADSKNTLDAIFAGEDIALAYSRCRVGIALHHTLAPPRHEAQAGGCQPDSSAFHARTRSSSSAVPTVSTLTGTLGAWRAVRMLSTTTSA